MIRLTLRTTPLSDGSESHDVLVEFAPNGEMLSQIVLHCHDEHRAEYLQETMRRAIVEYTNDPVVVSHTVGMTF